MDYQTMCFSSIPNEIFYICRGFIKDMYRRITMTKEMVAGGPEAASRQCRDNNTYATEDEL